MRRKKDCDLNEVGVRETRRIVDEAAPVEMLAEEQALKIVPHPGLKIISPDDAIEDPSEQACAIKPILTDNSAMVTSGDGGTGKSLAHLDLALCCVSEGKLWLARFEVMRRPVLYVDFESGEQRIRRRLFQLMRAKEYGKRVHKLGFVFGGFAHTEPAAWDRFCLDLDAVREDSAPTPFVIIDPWGKFSIVNENDNGEINKILVTWIDRIKQELGSPVSIVHHVSADGRTRGATALPDGVETAITISPGHEGCVWRPTKVRDAPFDPFMVKIERLNGGLSIYATDLPRQQGAIERILRRLIGEGGEPTTIGGMRKAIKTERGEGINAGTLEATLKAMGARPVKTEIRGREYEGWTLREGSEKR